MAPAARAISWLAVAAREGELNSNCRFLDTPLNAFAPDSERFLRGPSEIENGTDCSDALC